MSETSTELERLTRAADEAAHRYQAARRALDDAWRAAAAAAQPLADYAADVAYQRRRPDPNEAQRLTGQFLAHVQRESLLVEPLDPTRPAAGVRVVDPRPAAELEAARAAADEARRARDQFASANARTLKAEQDQAAMERVRDAVAGGDPDRLRDALGLNPKPTTVLRTSDAIR